VQPPSYIEESPRSATMKSVERGRRTRDSCEISRLKASAVAVTLLLVTVFLLPSCGTAHRQDQIRTWREETPVVDPLAVEPPAIRIGLEGLAAGALTVRADGGLVLFDPLRGKIVSGNRATAQLSFFVEGSTGAAPAPVFRVQVASVREKGNADKLAAEIRRRLGETVVVRYSSQTRTYRVQVGEAASREETGAVETRLHQAGYAETWVVREAAAAVGDGRLVAVDAGGSRVAAAAVFRCAPARPGEIIEVGGAGYRGILELRTSEDGLVLPVNVVNLDQYLRGVVPAEMSPTAYPQLEALKAQAVAARTYAVKNRNQYASQGYDICESARCQVYSGVKVEHELTDRAVMETKGEVAVYDGKPINALFTSTCGGHTEDSANIFAGETEPYLVGVECEPEAELFSRLQADEEPAVTYGADGLPLDYEMAALTIVGVLTPTFALQAKAEVDGGQWSNWVGRAAALLGRRPAVSHPGLSDKPLLKEAIVYLVADLGWQERIRKQVSEGDLRILMGFEGTGRLDGETGRDLLYFLRLGFISPEPDGRLPFDEPLKQTAAIRMICRLLDAEGGLGAAEGRLVRAFPDRIELRREPKVESFPVAGRLRLFKRFQSYTVPVRSLQMAPGDTVQVILRQGRVALIVHTPSLEGIASDRASRFFQWDVSYTPEELEAQVRRNADVGRIVELRPLRYGVSERIVELEVAGTKGRAVFKGLQIRWALGLRENLFVIEKSFDELGNVKTWRFIGKGWGHGVGLCQVGASGMAVAGKSYREILKHYYSGVEIEKIY
jgi:stage II sporulation protein D